MSDVEIQKVNVKIHSMRKEIRSDVESMWTEIQNVKVEIRSHVERIRKCE